ncbi:DUF6491 family protein [Luteibacter sp. NPDC031894]|uniref:DUF6491 family protein n=1 Tax=Luteibacter sp. NPDC031894 TaxID=3390572 RepID=UPI003D0909DB
MNVRYLLAASLLVTCAVQAQDARPQARHELPVNDCMRTDRISNWAMVDDRTVVVANGPNFFKITTSTDCPRMDLGGGVRFRGAENIQAVAPMRICGSITEKIVRRNEPPCDIASVEKIDKETYKSLEKKAKRKGSGAEPNGMVH